MNNATLIATLQPQNILGMLATGVRDIGFAGGDWVQELVSARATL